MRRLIGLMVGLGVVAMSAAWLASARVSAAAAHRTFAGAALVPARDSPILRLHRER